MWKNTAIPLWAVLARILPLHSLWRLADKPLIAICWHAIGTADELPHIRHLYTPHTCKQFAQDLDWLLDHFEPLSLEEVCAIAQGKQSCRHPACWISFDDGLRQVYEYAWPQLQRRGVPFTVFLNSAFIDNADLFFRYKASLLIDHWLQSPPAVTTQRAIKAVLPRHLANNLPHSLLRIGFRQKKWLDSIAHLLHFDFKQWLTKYQPYLTQTQIRQMACAGVTFGGHSHTHPLYSQLSLDEQLEQTQKSMACMSALVPDQQCRPFAFPFTDYGISSRFFEQACHKQLFDCSFGTAGLRHDVQQGHLQRHPIERWPYPATQQIPAALAWQILLRFLGRAYLKH